MEHDPFVSHKSQTLSSEEAPPSFSSFSVVIQRPQHCHRQAKLSVSQESSRVVIVVVLGIIVPPLPFIESSNVVYYDTIFLLPFFNIIYLGNLSISVYREFPSCLSHCMDIQWFILRALIDILVVCFQSFATTRLQLITL